MYSKLLYLICQERFFVLFFYQISNQVLANFQTQLHMFTKLVFFQDRGSFFYLKHVINYVFIKSVQIYKSYSVRL